MVQLGISYVPAVRLMDGWMDAEMGFAPHSHDQNLLSLM